jgi:DNA-binding NtrC family response regulator
VVLCVSPDGVRHSLWMLILRTWGYDVTGAFDAETALAWVETREPGCVDLLIANAALPFVERLMRHTRQSHPEVRVLLMFAGTRPTAFDSDNADCVFEWGPKAAFDLRMQIKTLLAVKRGPKKKEIAHA